MGSLNAPRRETSFFFFFFERVGGWVGDFSAHPAAGWHRHSEKATVAGLLGLMAGAGPGSWMIGLSSCWAGGSRARGCWGQHEQETRAARACSSIIQKKPLSLGCWGFWLGRAGIMDGAKLGNWGQHEQETRAARAYSSIIQKKPLSPG